MQLQFRGVTTRKVVCKYIMIEKHIMTAFDHNVDCSVCGEPGLVPASGHSPGAVWNSHRLHQEEECAPSSPGWWIGIPLYGQQSEWDGGVAHQNTVPCRLVSQLVTWRAVKTIYWQHRLAVLFSLLKGMWYSTCWAYLTIQLVDYTVIFMLNMYW